MWLSILLLMLACATRQPEPEPEPVTPDPCETADGVDTTCANDLMLESDSVGAEGGDSVDLAP